MAQAAPATDEHHPAKRRIKTPSVIQMEATECGAACLGMVLAYFGKIVPLEELRIVCGVSRDGSNAANVMKAGRSYGLEAKAFRKEPSALQEMQLPQIAFWEFYHFVVIEGFDKEVVYLNDPAVGPRTVTHEQFDDSFTGVVMTFGPGPEFVPGGKREKVMSRLGRRLGKTRAAIAYLVLAGLALVVPGLVIPTFTKVFVDDYLIGQQPGVVSTILLGLAGGAVLTGVLTWMRQHYLLRLQTKLSVRMAGGFMWHILRLPVSFFAQRSIGDLAYRVTLNDLVSQLLSGSLTTNILNVFTAAFYVILMYFFDPLLATIAVILASLNFLALRLVSRRRVDTNNRLMVEQFKVEGTSVTGLQTIETMKASGTESDFFSRWSGLLAKVINSRQALDVPGQPLNAFPALLAAISTAAVLGIGGYRVIQGDLTVGTLIAFQTLLASFLAPIAGFVQLGSQLQQISSSLERLDDVLNYDVDLELQREDEVSLERSKLRGNLELRAIEFGYNRLADPLIADFHMRLEPGQRVAIVGATGSGKSTTAKVITGLYPAWSGEVLFDGEPRGTIPHPILANSVAIVDQEISLFEGTIRENLTLWDPTIPEEAIVQAATDAAIHEDIAARSGGYSAIVEEGGRNFSGGQRQRLEIARALVRDPAILVLDEATSALDPLTEVKIDQSLRRRGCTCVIIAHRLSTIRDADEIIVLDHGKIVQRGTHESLKDEDGPYALLVGAENG